MLRNTNFSAVGIDGFSAIGKFLWLAGLAVCPRWLPSLPASGPSASDFVRENQTGDLGGYVLVDIDERIASICNAQPRNIVRVFSDPRPAPEYRFGIGDPVSVTIWEAAAGGLFSAAPTQIRRRENSNFA